MGLDFFDSADALGKIFYVFAIFGTVFFLIRTAMMFIGGDGEMDLDMDGSGDVDVGMDSDVAFQFFSLNSLTAFFMMFGWSGLTSYIQFELGAAISIVIAFVVGILAMLFVAWLFKMAMKLTSKGADFKISDTIGLTGSVYQQIPTEGLGKVNVSMPNGMLRELDSISEDKVAIESFKTVKVVRVVDTKTIAVRLVE